MKMPWPVSNRDIVNQREIRQDPVTKVVTIIDTALPDAEPRKDYVRIVKSHQQWRLPPTADGQTTVQIQLLSDPGGIPAALITAMRSEARRVGKECVGTGRCGWSQEH